MMSGGDSIPLSQQKWHSSDTNFDFDSTLTAATATLTISGTELVASEDPSSADLTVDGVQISVDISDGASNETIAFEIAAAVDLNAGFSASAAGNTVSITHGTAGAGENGSTISATALEAAIDLVDASDNDANLSPTAFAGGGGSGATLGGFELQDSGSGTGDSTGCLNRNLGVREDHTATGETNEFIYWKLRVPGGQPAGSYSGLNTFTATSSQTCLDGTVY
jgi:hypothetical protein